MADFRKYIYALALVALLAGLTAVAAAIRAEEPLDDIVVAGDLLQGGPRPREVWEFLVESGWTLIRGNEDDSLQADAPPNYLGPCSLSAGRLRQGPSTGPKGR